MDKDISSPGNLFPAVSQKLMKGLACLLLLMLAGAFPSLAAMRTEAVTYTSGGTPFVGYLAYDDAATTPRSAVLIVPDWWGVNDAMKRRAEQVASLGAIVFVADIYGNGQVARDQNEAKGLADRVLQGDRKILLDRVNAGLQQLQGHPLADKGKVAAIGYGPGGTGVLELARSGAALNGAASFNGKLDTPRPAAPGSIKTRVLVIDGENNPYVPKSQIAGFMDEMGNANADWQMIIYGGAGYGFTDPGAGADQASGIAYNEQADQRAWNQLKLFFTEIFS